MLTKWNLIKNCDLEKLTKDVLSALITISRMSICLSGGMVFTEQKIAIRAIEAATGEQWDNKDGEII